MPERRPRDDSTHFSDFFAKFCFHPWFGFTILMKGSSFQSIHKIMQCSIDYITLHGWLWSLTWQNRKKKPAVTPYKHPFIIVIILEPIHKHHFLSVCLSVCVDLNKKNHTIISHRYVSLLLNFLAIYGRLLVNFNDNGRWAHINVKLHFFSTAFRLLYRKKDLNEPAY